jgi:hypothetical protein
MVHYEDSFRCQLTPEQMSASEALTVKIKFSTKGDERYERKR